MSRRVPVLRGNTRETGWSIRSVEWGDYTTQELDGSIYPVAFTEAQLVEMLRVRSWQIDLNLNVTNFDNPGFTTYNVNVAGAYAVSFADTFDHNNLDPSGATDSRQADNEAEMLSLWRPGTQDIDIDTQHATFEPFMFMWAHGNVAFGSGTTTIHGCDPSFQGIWTGTWQGFVFGGGFEFTLVLGLGGLLFVPLYPFESVPGSSAEILYDPVTKLYYPRIYCQFSVNVSSAGVAAGTIKQDPVHDISAGSFTLMGQSIPMWWTPVGASLAFTNMTVSGTVVPKDYWPFKNGYGQEVYNVTTGVVNDGIDPFGG